MPIAQSHKIQALSQSADPKAGVLKAVGPLNGVEVFSGWILLGTYIRPEKTTGGIIRPQSNVDEDAYQGKVGLVLKKGPLAFVDDDSHDFAGQDVRDGDWVAYYVNDTRAVTINGAPCRLIQDTRIIMKIDDPNIVF